MELPKPPSLPQPPSLPAASAECTATTQPAQPGAPAQQMGYNIARSGDGKMRIDYGATSVITDPASGKAILLDHLKKEARTIPLPQAPAPPAMPQASMPGMPGAPQPPSLPPGTTVKDLGKRLVEGHEVEGKQFTMPPPGVPSLPAPPQLPAVAKPALPGMPQAPQAPQPPVPAAIPTVTEAWTSTKLHLPVLTRTTGPFGKQTCHCKNLSGMEPPASLFQVPADYKQAIPKPPKL
ncbi:MAG: hypothetical protein KGN36_00060 [Acidobacteriota bacterium]|nr:hypothetical protein [Acidobacteriota bacterium]